MIGLAIMISSVTLYFPKQKGLEWKHRKSEKLKKKKNSGQIKKI